MAYTPRSAADARYVEVAGDTMTGQLQVNTGTSSSVSIQALTGQYAGLYLAKDAATHRWTLMKTNTAESGSNAGSDLEIKRYADNGSALPTAIAFNRATGLGTVAGDPTAALGIATKQYVDRNPGTIKTLWAYNTAPGAYVQVRLDCTGIDLTWGRLGASLATVTIGKQLRLAYAGIWRFTVDWWFNVPGDAMGGTQSAVRFVAANSDVNLTSLLYPGSVDYPSVFTGQINIGGGVSSYDAFPVAGWINPTSLSATMHVEFLGAV